MYRYQEEPKLDLKAFYKKRFFSIYPLFWITYVMAFFWVFWQLGRGVPDYSHQGDYLVCYWHGWLAGTSGSYFLYGRRVVFGKYHYPVCSISPFTGMV